MGQQFLTNIYMIVQLKTIMLCIYVETNLHLQCSWCTNYKSLDFATLTGFFKSFVELLGFFFGSIKGFRENNHKKSTRLSSSFTTLTCLNFQQAFWCPTNMQVTLIIISRIRRQNSWPCLCVKSAQIKLQAPKVLEIKLPLQVTSFHTKEI